ncbi:Restriction endonuclease NotI [Planctomycetes bacterium K2D]|nr:Restriction endonuclease NotI [Planctomycetes bacterium K2D]
MLGTNEPKVVAEIRFLRRNDDNDGESAGEDASSEDVGNIDNVLVNPSDGDLEWCALEIQAVYFSGRKMSLLFNHILTHAGPELPFPDSVRRPDYRSSGPKRLMPQLQIKVPTLRRWGKKMAIVVDIPWFQTNVVGVPTVNDVSNSDIAWFLVGFDESTDPATLTVSGPELQTLERAVEGLTGGYPVTLAEFESKIRDKLNPPQPRTRRARREPNQGSGQ